MFLAAQTAVLAATFTPTTLTAAALGLLGGICLNVSIDGALSILPAFAYFLSRSPSPLAGLRLACIAGLVGIIAAVVPFSPENVSPLQYYHLFQVTSRHPWQRWFSCLSWACMRYSDRNYRSRSNGSLLPSCYP